jgi:hypothetical protein
VSVDQISFSGSAGSAEVNTRRLEAALQDSLLQA